MKRFAPDSVSTGGFPHICWNKERSSTSVKSSRFAPLHKSAPPHNPVPHHTTVPPSTIPPLNAIPKPTDEMDRSPRPQVDQYLNKYYSNPVFQQEGQRRGEEWLNMEQGQKWNPPRTDLPKFDGKNRREALSG